MNTKNWLKTNKETPLKQRTVSSKGWYFYKKYNENYFLRSVTNVTNCSNESRAGQSGKVCNTSKASAR